MNIGLDVGYSATKAVSGNRRVTFPSVVGTPDEARFSLNGTENSILVYPAHVQVGASAARQSRHIKRREDRGWIESAEWYQLFLYALSELTTVSVSATLVTGLPVAFYNDKDRLQSILSQDHTVERLERNRQTIKVGQCRVVPQPFGALLADCLNNAGTVLREPGNVGVIDVGGKTTNILSVQGFEEIGRETTSVSVGAWDVARSVRRWLADECPDREVRDTALMQAIQERSIGYFGRQVDLSEAVEDALQPMAEEVIAEATQLWNGAAGLDSVLVTGGGAILLGDRIKAHFPHARVVNEPVWANALGFWRFAQYLGRG